MAGLPAGYRVAGEAEMMILKDDLIASVLTREVVPREERSLIPAGSLDAVLRACWRLIGSARENLHTTKTFEDALCKDKPQDMGQAGYEYQVACTAARLFHEFDRAKNVAGIVDYTDLINGLYGLLKSSAEVRKRIRDRFSYIIVDEFQDTNLAQLELLHLLARDGFSNVTVVGDDKQAIYEWRGARIENLREFAGEELFLADNYRSYNEILDLANYSITRDSYFAERAGEIKLANPVKGCSSGGHVHLARFDSRKSEAVYIARETGRLINSGVSPGNIAVLYRSTTHTKTLEDEFRGLGIPYTALGAGFFEREEVRDLLAYLELASNPAADMAATRVLSRAPVSLSQAQLALLAARRGNMRQGTHTEVSLFETLKQSDAIESLEPAAQERVRKALVCIESLHSLRMIEPLPVLAERAFNESGLLSVLSADNSPAALRSVSSISKIIDLAIDFESRSPVNGLPEFVRYLHRLIRMGELREAEADPQEEGDAVKILTTFKAKGLEFHTVFVVDVRPNRFRKTAAFLLDLPPAIGTPAGGRVVAKYMPGSKKASPAYEEILDKLHAKERHEQEERRIFYVALTRAKENLYITTAVENSAFFDELADEFASSELVEIVQDAS
jgi:superfamily I DNA/RNA helicase